MTKTEAEEIAAQLHGGVAVPHPDRGSQKDRLWLIVDKAEPFDTLDPENGWQISIHGTVVF